MAASAWFLAQPCPKRLKEPDSAAEVSLATRTEPGRLTWLTWPRVASVRDSWDRAESASLGQPRVFPTPTTRPRRKWSRSIFRRTRRTERVLTPLSNDAAPDACASSRILSNISTTPSATFSSIGPWFLFRRRNRANLFSFSPDFWILKTGRTHAADFDEYVFHTCVVLERSLVISLATREARLSSGDEISQVWRESETVYAEATKYLVQLRILQWDRESVK